MRGVGVALVLLAFPLAGVAQARERADRTELQKRLGRQGVVDLDRRTGTPRVLARLDGTLSGPSSRAPEAIATAYVRANLGVLGLTAADVDADALGHAASPAASRRSSGARRSTGSPRPTTRCGSTWAATGAC